MDPFFLLSIPIFAAAFGWFFWFEGKRLGKEEEAGFWLQKMYVPGCVRLVVFLSLANIAVEFQIDGRISAVVMCALGIDFMFLIHRYQIAARKIGYEPPPDPPGKMAGKMVFKLLASAIGAFLCWAISSWIASVF